MIPDQNRVMLVTGANSGMGLAATVALARTDATVVMLCRDQIRGSLALEQAKSLSGNDKIELMIADLADLDSISAFCSVFHTRYSRLDVLINNAGVITPSRKETKQGFELVFGVNHIGHFLLTLLLADIISQTAGSRVVIVSSGAHKVGRIHFEDVNLTRNFNTIKSYSQSKLANVLFTRELARRMSAYNTAVNCCHPGAVATSMGINRETGFGKTITRLLKPFFRTPDKGAETAVSLALSTLGQSNCGAYFYNNKVAKASKRALNNDSALKLWQLSINLTEPWLKNVGNLPDVLR